jgi:hypothetical protein
LVGDLDRPELTKAFKKIQKGAMLCVLLLVPLLQLSAATLESCSQFQAVQGVEVNLGVKKLAYAQWNSAICTTLHSKSVMVAPKTQALAIAMCDMFGNSWPWAGLYFDNATAAKWIWTDGTDISTTPVSWTFNSATPHPVDGVKNCGEIWCSFNPPTNRGKLYNDNCTKTQDIICQVDCEFFH